MDLSDSGWLVDRLDVIDALIHARLACKKWCLYYFHVYEETDEKGNELLILILPGLNPIQKEYLANPHSARFRIGKFTLLLFSEPPVHETNNLANIKCNMRFFKNFTMTSSKSAFSRDFQEVYGKFQSSSYEDD